jgi:2-C-methyl-D-erythritol 4-phosphate cytidylyltransferase
VERRPESDCRAPAGRERSVAAVVLAGGSGLRIGQGRNKAYLPLAGQTAVGLSLRTMVGLPGLRRLLLVVRADDVDLAERTLDEELPHPPVPVELVLGGSTRHGSEDRALQHLAPAVATGEVDLVLIHDAARPLCSPNLVIQLLEAAAAHGGAVPGLVADDLARIDEDGNLTPLTGDHVRVQTPQAFVAAPLLEAYRRASEAGFDSTDTSACIERFSPMRVQHVAGEQQNFKITYPHDLYAAESFVRRSRLGQE